MYYNSHRTSVKPVPKTRQYLYGTLTSTSSRGEFSSTTAVSASKTTDASNDNKYGGYTKGRSGGVDLNTTRKDDASRTAASTGSVSISTAITTTTTSPDPHQPAKPLPKGRLYHFNFIYNHARCPLSATADTEKSLAWTKRAVEKLELEGLVNSYYHDRDCPKGQGLAQELGRVIEASQVTVVVLSPGFVRDCWPRYWMLSCFRQLFANLPQSAPSATVPSASSLPSSSSGCSSLSSSPPGSASLSAGDSVRSSGYSSFGDTRASHSSSSASSYLSSSSSSTASASKARPLSRPSRFLLSGYSSTDSYSTSSFSVPTPALSSYSSGFNSSKVPSSPGINGKREEDSDSTVVLLVSLDISPDDLPDVLKNKEVLFFTGESPDDSQVWGKLQSTIISAVPQPSARQKTSSVAEEEEAVDADVLMTSPYDYVDESTSREEQGDAERNDGIFDDDSQETSSVGTTSPGSPETSNTTCSPAAQTNCNSFQSILQKTVQQLITKQEVLDHLSGEDGDTLAADAFGTEASEDAYFTDDTDELITEDAEDDFLTDEDSSFFREKSTDAFIREKSTDAFIREKSTHAFIREKYTHAFITEKPSDAAFISENATAAPSTTGLLCPEAKQPGSSEQKRSDRRPLLQEDDLASPSSSLHSTAKRPKLDNSRGEEEEDIDEWDEGEMSKASHESFGDVVRRSVSPLLKLTTNHGVSDVDGNENCYDIDSSQHCNVNNDVDSDEHCNVNTDDNGSAEDSADGDGVPRDQDKSSTHKLNDDHQPNYKTSSYGQSEISDGRFTGTVVRKSGKAYVYDGDDSQTYFDENQFSAHAEVDNKNISMADDVRRDKLEDKEMKMDTSVFMVKNTDGHLAESQATSTSEDKNASQLNCQNSRAGDVESSVLDRLGQAGLKREHESFLHEPHTNGERTPMTRVAVKGNTVTVDTFHAHELTSTKTDTQDNVQPRKVVMMDTFRAQERVSSRLGDEENAHHAPYPSTHNAQSHIVEDTVVNSSSSGDKEPHMLFSNSGEIASFGENKVSVVKNMDEQLAELQSKTEQLAESQTTSQSEDNNTSKLNCQNDSTLDSPIPDESSLPAWQDAPTEAPVNGQVSDVLHDSSMETSTHNVNGESKATGLDNADSLQRDVVDSGHVQTEAGIKNVKNQSSEPKLAETSVEGDGNTTDRQQIANSRESIHTETETIETTCSLDVKNQSSEPKLAETSVEGDGNTTDRQQITNSRESIHTETETIEPTCSLDEVNIRKRSQESDTAPNSEATEKQAKVTTEEDLTLTTHRHSHECKEICRELAAGELNKGTDKNEVNISEESQENDTAPNSATQKQAVVTTVEDLTLKTLQQSHEDKEICREPAAGDLNLVTSLEDDHNLSITECNLASSVYGTLTPRHDDLSAISSGGGDSGFGMSLSSLSSFGDSIGLPPASSSAASPRESTPRAARQDTGTFAVHGFHDENVDDSMKIRDLQDDSRDHTLGALDDSDVNNRTLQEADAVLQEADESHVHTACNDLDTTFVPDPGSSSHVDVIHANDSIQVSIAEEEAAERLKRKELPCMLSSNSLSTDVPNGSAVTKDADFAHKDKVALESNASHFDYNSFGGTDVESNKEHSARSLKNAGNHTDEVPNGAGEADKVYRDDHSFFLKETHSDLQDLPKPSQDTGEKQPPMESLLPADSSTSLGKKHISNETSADSFAASARSNEASNSEASDTASNNRSEFESSSSNSYDISSVTKNITCASLKASGSSSFGTGDFTKSQTHVGEEVDSVRESLTVQLSTTTTATDCSQEAVAGAGEDKPAVLIMRASSSSVDGDVAAATSEQHQRRDSWTYEDVDREWSRRRIWEPLYRVIVHALTRPEMPFF